MINVYTTKLTPRVDYAFRLIFETILNSKVLFFIEKEAFEAAQGVKINYSEDATLTGMLFIPAGLLHEGGIQYQYPEVFEWEDEKVFFRVEKSTLPFDIFAASFYMVSRYEEFLTGKRDRHQRFMARNSLAGRSGFLEKPVVNIWALKLAETIAEEYPKVKFKKSKFKYQPTIDIDNAWAFKNKGFVRIMLSMGKDVLKARWGVLRKRMAVVNRLERDPYDNYDFMLDVLKTFQFRPVYFFLLNNKGKYDRSLSHKNLFYRNLILKLAKTGKIGLHPSYRSNKNTRQLAIEIKRFKSITTKKVKRSRQHFLKMNMPKTYRNLIEQGIKADYTMGFPTRPGFRAGIATPFYFFDVLEDQTTTLKVYPFQVMDVTLLHYRNLRAVDASRKIEKLMRETAKVGGTFISLWHNESMSDEGLWKGWRDVYTNMTRLAAELRDGEKDKDNT